jgi:outer membrane protein assembly factor BamA
MFHEQRASTFRRNRSGSRPFPIAHDAAARHLESHRQSITFSPAMVVPALVRPIVAMMVAAALASACAHKDAPGDGVWVHSLVFKGNKAISSRTLRGKLATTKTGWWPFAARKWYDAAAFDLDLKRIPALYADNGYFDARVVDYEVKQRSHKSVDINVVIDEGAPTKIDRVVIEGFPDPSQTKRIQNLADSWDFEPGAAVKYQDYTALKSKAEDRLKEDGYAYGKIAGDIAVDRDQQKAIVTLKTEPGPVVHLGKTDIVGNAGIPLSKLQRRITWQPGDRYDPGDLSTTQGRLYDLGVFSSVRIELPPEPTPQADVRIHLTPSKLHELRLGAGVGVERQREEVRLRAMWTFSNFLGGLRKLRLRAKPAYVVIPSVANIERHGPAAELDAQLIQPDFLDASTTLRGLAGYDLMITEGYQAHGPRGQVAVDRPFFRDHLQVAVNWNLQYLDFFNVNADVFDPTRTTLGFGFRDPYRLAFVEELLQLDLRDRPLDPTFGGFVALRLEQGSPYLGGGFTYTKVTPELRLYVPLGRRIVVATRGLLGWLRPFGDAGTESPLTRRYQLGGPSSHRGFTFGRLSPQIADRLGRLIPLGGNGEVLMSLEARLDLIKLADNWLGLVPFVDAGDVTVAFADLSLARLHYATGLSLEYQTPIGILRSGIGVRLNRLAGISVPGEPPANPDPGRRIAFHLTIGEAF